MCADLCHRRGQDHGVEVGSGTQLTLQSYKLPVPLAYNVGFEALLQIGQVKVIRSPPLESELSTSPPPFLLPCSLLLRVPRDCRASEAIRWFPAVRSVGFLMAGT